MVVKNMKKFEFEMFCIFFYDFMVLEVEFNKNWDKLVIDCVWNCGVINKDGGRRRSSRRKGWLFIYLFS